MVSSLFASAADRFHRLCAWNADRAPCHRHTIDPLEPFAFSKPGRHFRLRCGIQIRVNVRSRGRCRFSATDQISGNGRAFEAFDQPIRPVCAPLMVSNQKRTRKSSACNGRFTLVPLRDFFKSPPFSAGTHPRDAVEPVYPLKTLDVYFKSEFSSLAIIPVRKGFLSHQEILFGKPVTELSMPASVILRNPRPFGHILSDQNIAALRPQGRKRSLSSPFPRKEATKGCSAFQNRFLPRRKSWMCQILMFWCLALRHDSNLYFSVELTLFRYAFASMNFLVISMSRYFFESTNI